MNTDLLRYSNSKLLIMFGCLLLMTACTFPTSILGQSDPAAVGLEPAASQTRHCEEPRPKICTMQYQPVCAVMESGSITTYPSACNACADIAVSAWRPEPCEE
ncbi:MAG: hypothetical protein ACPG55_05640 [Luminiphilus sp.]